MSQHCRAATFLFWIHYCLCCSQPDFVTRCVFHNGIHHFSECALRCSEFDACVQQSSPKKERRPPLPITKQSSQTNNHHTATTKPKRSASRQFFSFLFFSFSPLLFSLFVFLSFVFSFGSSDHVLLPGLLSPPQHFPIQRTTMNVAEQGRVSPFRDHDDPTSNLMQQQQQQEQKEQKEQQEQQEQQEPSTPTHQQEQTQRKRAASPFSAQKQHSKSCLQLPLLPTRASAPALSLSASNSPSTPRRTSRSGRRKS